MLFNCIKFNSALCVNPQLKGANMEFKELTMEEVNQASGGGSIVAAGFGTGLATAAVVGFGFFGPVGAISSATAFALGFGGGTALQKMFR
jgi:hypothetical protein